MRELRGGPDADSLRPGALAEAEVVEGTHPAYDPVAEVAPRSSEPRDPTPTGVERPGLELLRSRLTDQVTARFGPRELEDWEADEYGLAIWGEATENLGPTERAALRAYSSESFGGRVCYREINGYLRGHQEGSPAVEDHIRSIDSAQRIVPVPEDVVVVRGTTARAFTKPVGALTGESITEDGYLSTSIGTTPAFDQQIWVHLQVPKGTPAIYMEGVTDHPGERELLLSRGLSYVVARIDYDDVRDRWQVHGRILTPHEQKRSGS